MPGSCRRNALIAGVVLLTSLRHLSPLAAAPPDGLPPMADIDVPPEVPHDAPQRVIVLHSGQTVIGDLEPRPGGYLVKQSGGLVVIPFTLIRLTARDLPDAYRKLQDTLHNPTAHQHIELARWCHSHKLYDSARAEIRRALILEPERRDARELLVQVERETSGELTVPVPRDAGPAVDGFRTPRPESLAGLSPETVQTYVRRIQPLVMNKCGNARCHGAAASNDFRLTPVRQGMSGFQTFTEHNLTALLRQVSEVEFTDSPVVRSTIGPHGGVTRPLFTGRGAEQQRTDLLNWLERAARERAHHAFVTGQPSSLTDSAEPLAAPGGRDPFLQQVLAEELPDAFDPEEFNRRWRRGGPTPE
jgi:hypothetical protein